MRRSCSTHIVMDAGEFRLSPGAGRCRPDGGRDSLVVTGPRRRSITRRTNDYRRTSLHCRRRPSRQPARPRRDVKSPRGPSLSLSMRRNSNQNFLAPRRTRSPSGAASCRRHRRTVGRFSTRTILFGRRPSFYELDGWILVTLRDSRLAKDRA